MKKTAIAILLLTSVAAAPSCSLFEEQGYMLNDTTVAMLQEKWGDDFSLWTEDVEKMLRAEVAEIRAVDGGVEAVLVSPVDEIASQHGSSFISRILENPTIQDGLAAFVAFLIGGGTVIRNRKRIARLGQAAKNIGLKVIGRKPNGT